MYYQYELTYFKGDMGHGVASDHCSCGRPHSLPPDGYLGLFLFYLGSTMSCKHLCMLFVITPSVCSCIINKMLSKVVKKLRNHPFAQVRFPDKHTMREYADMVQLREPEVDDIIGFMDGVSFSSECTDERIEQNAYYCGYNCDTMVNNIFAFGPDGKVFFAAINFPGSWADGALTARFLAHIKTRIGSYKICVDQGFPRNGNVYDNLVGPMSRRTAGRVSPFIHPYLLQLSNCYVSLRQASEWGMRGLQGSFPRFKKQLPKQQDKEEEYNPVHSPCP